MVEHALHELHCDVYRFFAGRVQDDSHVTAAGPWLRGLLRDAGHVQQPTRAYRPVAVRRTRRQLRSGGPSLADHHWRRARRGD